MMYNQIGYDSEKDISFDQKYKTNDIESDLLIGSCLSCYENNHPNLVNMSNCR